ncbi:hypothetical protein Cadr_000029520 [Camelus dromedarius]|uniref:Uncharacterized protein n=1 Tax=Camelus dromedarius TaxID=9838 RepID=A0A5N4CAU4_CAMDR|nr:hypothetical protein Cadr_000029520 [Camelus dromedarius]
MRQTAQAGWCWLHTWDRVRFTTIEGSVVLPTDGAEMTGYPRGGKTSLGPSLSHAQK